MNPLPDPWNRRIRWATYARARSVVWPLRYRVSGALLGRHACLGADVLAVLKPERTIINIQKGRVDYLLDCWRDRGLRARTSEALEHVSREEIVPCVVQEQLLYDWCSPSRPVALYMDSMAELADRRFVHKRDRWSFVCVNGDTTRSEKLARLFESAGLIELGSIEEYYRTFFSEVRRRFGQIPIFYLHFPTALEQRPKYLARAASIREVVDKLSREIPRLHSIAVDESIVRFPDDAPPNMEDFPYHYNRETYADFARRLIDTGDWKWTHRE